MRRSLPLLLVAVFTVTCSIRAQAPPENSPEHAPSRGPDHGPRTIIPGIDVPPYPGLPFSGVDTIVWTRTGEGGGTTTLYIASKVARDGQGRTYREHHRFAMADVDQATTLYEFYILDPVARTRTACEPATHLCIITSYRPYLNQPPMPVGSFDHNRRNLSRDSLGTQTLDGLPVTGTRETTTIAPGTNGNDREITYSREFWYSEDLKTNLSVTRQDPHNGTQAIHLTVDSRSDPDPGIFAIPSGYTVKDDRTTNAPHPE